MSLNRYATKRDAVEPDIIEALEKAGAEVWQLDEPCDLLYRFRGRWGVMECKDPKARPRKTQKRQNDFIERTQCPIVRNPQQAIEALTRRTA